MYNYTPQATHHAMFDFDPTTCVVWANSQFATVSGVFLLSFLPSFLSFFLRLAYKSISRRHIDRLMRNLDRKYRITCQYRTHDQICNFQKFKMADSRHFENSCSISQKWIIQFQWNLILRYKFPFWACKFDKKKSIFFANSRWRTDAILINVFGYISCTILADLCKFRNGDEESHADIGQLTKMAIFANSRWRQPPFWK